MADEVNNTEVENNSVNADAAKSEAAPADAAKSEAAPADAAKSEAAPADAAKSEAAPADAAKSEAAPADAAKSEPAKKVIPKHHFTIIDAFLGTCAVIFVFCCVGMIIPSTAEIARIAGLVLSFVLISGLFYATLHLQKVG